MTKNQITVENLFLSIIDIVTFGKNVNQLKYHPGEEKIIKSIYDRLSNDFIFNGNLCNSHLSTKQFNLIINFIRKNRDFVIKEKIISEELFKKLLEEKNTNLKIYESSERIHRADLVSPNLLGLYFPNSKYLRYEVKKIFEDSFFDKELNLFLVEIRKNNISEILTFLNEHKFVVSENLKNTLNLYNSMKNNSFVKLEKNGEDFLKLETFNFDVLLVKILHTMELDNDS